ncbi:protein of unknown function; putative membrane protein (plasmid) [Methylorubrum extorquens DM4]|jgi:hypothetical protein|uniref:SMODS-associated and fused to various effectors domain-containing protein n=3 Tax=Methylorubrum TaxID=2282523 RepID=A0A160PLK7_9HYPH|nr:MULTISPECIES: SAVED domain-containing protein [Methylorubrum]BAU94106.1 hypothetical protein MPPM_5501 [Methylorubrum populi]CAX17148.1 protein of unknown function; putative membrane protein [Methylorubrum extorquens DM4]
MMKLIRRIRGKEEPNDPLPGTSYRVTGGALVLAGLAVISPGVKDALLALANNTYNLGLSLDAPWWIGLPLVSLGLLLFILGFVTDRSGTNKGQFVAIRHQSFQPLAANLPKEAMPRRMQRRKIQVYDCDLSSFMNSQPVDPAGAVRLQEKLAQHIAGVRRSDHDAALGYYGIVHIPFQFLAGCSISTYPEVALFELNRNTNQWHELNTGDGTNLKPKLIRSIDPANPTAAVIRIEISYPISPAEPAKLIQGPYREYALRIEAPGIDKISHYGQVHTVSKLFREALDEIHNELGNAPIVHVFYSGPVSLGFSLGRQISRTIHNRVFVYNYTSQSNPAYAWGIDVTRDSPPHEMVVWTRLV